MSWNKEDYDDLDQSYFDGDIGDARWGLDIDDPAWHTGNKEDEEDED